MSDEYLDGDINSERLRLWTHRLSTPRDDQMVLVAEVERVAVGFACAFGSADPRWGTDLDNLHVRRDWQGWGVGKRLFGQVAQWACADYPGSGLYLWVLEANTQARVFYHRLGGQPVGDDSWMAPCGRSIKRLRYAWSSSDANALLHDSQDWSAARARREGGRPVTRRTRGLVEAFYERIWRNGDLGAATELLTSNFAFRGSLGAELRGVQAFTGYVRSVREPLEDYRCDILECVSEENRAFAKMRFGGRHVGIFRGYAATGKPVHWLGAALFRFEGPAIAELWVLGDLPQPGCRVEGEPGRRRREGRTG